MDCEPFLLVFLWTFKTWVDWVHEIGRLGGLRMEWARRHDDTFRQTAKRRDDDANRTVQPSALTAATATATAKTTTLIMPQYGNKSLRPVRCHCRLIRVEESHVGIAAN